MEYMVVGADGKEYGPASVDTLEKWAAEGRIMPTTVLKDRSGQSVQAIALLRAFAAAPPVAIGGPVPVSGGLPASPSNYNRPPSPNWSAAPAYGVRKQDSGDWGIVYNVIGRSALALVFFFLFHGLGLITGSYALFYAIRAAINGHRHRVLMISIAATCLALVIIGWVFRIGGSQGLQQF